MKIFVAGGAGFIGSHFVAYMLSQSDKNLVTVYDNFCSGTKDHLVSFVNNERLNIITGDIKNFDDLCTAMRGADLVVNFAANADIAKAVTQPDIDFWEGTFLANNILEAVRTNNVKRILYTSGSGVYGEVPDQVFTENFGPCVPISAYGASKIACEALLSAYCHMFGIWGRVFRFANVVGPRQTHGVGYDFIRKLSVDPTCLRILGDGSQSKSYIHVDDVVQAMITVLENSDPDIRFDVFNASTDDHITVTEIAEIACSTLNLKTDSVRFEYTGGDRGWAGDVPKVKLSAEKLKSLKWRANRSSKEAILASLESIKIEVRTLNA